MASKRLRKRPAAWALCAALAFGALLAPTAANAQTQPETKAEKDRRMQWWREARFGMFIHWGLYAMPAGQWKGKTNHAEWIRETAQIPIQQYDKLLGQFNPREVQRRPVGRAPPRMRESKYIVITSKHHDGFCLFDSKYTDYNVMSTPFHRDIMKELAEACRRQGIRICWYHSIMDWHHPDYLPRRNWEKRSADGRRLSIATWPT